MLISLFSDAIREVRKYSDKDLGRDAKLQQNMYDHMHMKLFRAQRNLYISGFAVFLWLWVSWLLNLFFNDNIYILYFGWLLGFFIFLNFLTMPLSFLQGHEAGGHSDKPAGVRVCYHSCSSGAGWQREPGCQEIHGGQWPAETGWQHVGLVRTVSPKSDFSPVWMVATNYCKQTRWKRSMISVVLQRLYIAMEKP